ncbi:ribosome small subunit-dependent GTPase A [Anaerotardibacter muris]|uniref:ribosome small subunit-dependent GTPase A n=1 Tax=Anaerotardibacter muris TaxID=2941505 RepID=UPI0020405345|nr:ribosome small subunit-dependent GTPase A [Anaerotardibacter muris]
MQQGVVVKLDRGYPLVRLASGALIRCEHATSLVKKKTDRAVIGDRVQIELPDGHEKGIIEAILPRTTQFVRKDPTERAVPQTLASNFDLVLIAQPIEEVNFKRLERELVLAHETGAQVAVVLTKADLVSERTQFEETCKQVKALVGNDQVFVVSQEDPTSLERVAQLIAEGDKTAVLIGRSGVGKSSLVNVLVGEEIQETTPVRESDGRGRHTTVSREIIPLPSGGYIIDMPGVRGLGLWDAEQGIRAAFSEIEALAESCKFRDCSHQQETGCAVRAAVEAGTLAPERLESYLRLKEECADVQAKRVEAERIRTRRGHPRHRAK